VLAALLALGSGISWGFADFLGGLKARQLPLLVVLVGSQSVGLALVATIVAVRGEAAPGGAFAVYAALSGVCGIVGLACFYRGLAVGAMSVVAPISALAAVIPVSFGLATGDRPSAIQIAGIALAIVGATLAAREPAHDASEDSEEASDENRRPIGGTHVAAGTGLALLAALGFGGFFVAMDRASNADVFWAILVNRVTGVTLLLIALAALRPSLHARTVDLATLAAIGFLDMSANTLFATASTKGLVSLVAVLGSLYPVTTVVLARAFLDERISRIQQVGVAAALTGVVMITAG
jgi:drug/metabolite transporter (DMT)-like permease